jgi:hypothetical protein
MATIKKTKVTRKPRAVKKVIKTAVTENTESSFLPTLKLIIIAFLLSVAISYASPSATPPGNNTPPPVNIGPTYQEKTNGGLSLDALNSLANSSLSYFSGATCVGVIPAGSTACTGTGGANIDLKDTFSTSSSLSGAGAFLDDHLKNFWAPKAEAKQTIISGMCPGTWDCVYGSANQCQTGYSCSFKCNDSVAGISYGDCVVSSGSGKFGSGQLPTASVACSGIASDSICSSSCSYTVSAGDPSYDVDCIPKNVLNVYGGDKKISSSLFIQSLTPSTTSSTRLCASQTGTLVMCD